jgi:regulator of replication initiation timing
MDEGFKLVFDYLYRIENELMEIRGEINDLRQELKGKADQERLDLLEERVRKVEMHQIILRDKSNKKYK